MPVPGGLTQLQNQILKRKREHFWSYVVAKSGTQQLDQNEDHETDWPSMKILSKRVMEQKPEGAEPMAAFRPDANGAFRVFFSILHLVETPSKILPLL
jgi:hypothetical protein